MNDYYSTIEEASLASQKLGIKTSNEYHLKYFLDDKLHSNPNLFYSIDWKRIGGYKGFLNINKYKTVEEASEAAIKLGINSFKEYKVRYHEDPKLPSIPSIKYKENWLKFGGWIPFLNANKYKTVKEASIAVKSLNITTEEEYRNRFIEDPMLPLYPERLYHENWHIFGSWSRYLSKKTNYKTIKEASEAAQKLNCKNYNEYLKSYMKDPLLPKNPQYLYSKNWKDFGGMQAFLSFSPHNNIYDNILDASNAAKKININSVLEYNFRYKEDPKLPKNPIIFYKSQWDNFGGWKNFINLVKSNKSKCYKNIQDASASAINLGITSKADYLKKHKQDPRLFIRPDVLYSFSGNFNWDIFLGNPLKISFIDFIKLIRSTNIKTIKEYKSFSQIKNGVPEYPEKEYSNMWKLIGGWDGVFELVYPDGEIKDRLSLFFEKNNLLYKKIEDASISAINLGINSISSYNKNRTKDPCLPPNPDFFYLNWKEFGMWGGFLKIDFKVEKKSARRIAKVKVKNFKNYYKTLKEAHNAIRKLNIKSFKEYRKLHKNDKMLPQNLPQAYQVEWESYGGWDKILS